MWYFCYGANMNSDTMRRRNIDIYNSVPFILKGYKLMFNKVYLGLFCFANIVPDELSAVPGVLYKISPEGLRKLENYEKGYQRVTVAPGVVTFLCSASTSSTTLYPSRTYLTSIVKGAQEHGLPNTYISLLQQYPTFEFPLESNRVVRKLIDSIQSGTQ